MVACIVSLPVPLISFGLRKYLPGDHESTGVEMGGEAMHDCGAWARLVLRDELTEEQILFVYRHSVASGVIPDFLRPFYVPAALCGECYICKMVALFRELHRVLRDDGVCFLNIGDSYNGSGGAGGDYSPGGIRAGQPKYPGRNIPGLQLKDMMLVPQRLVLALQANGWVVRNEVIWCLSGGTLVYARTQKGDMPMMIKDLARLKPETVQLWNGDRWTRLLGVSRSPRNGTEIELTLRSGERIACTPNHKFPTQRGLLETSDIQIGDKLKRVSLPEPDVPKDSIYMGEDAAWFAGLFIAEGSRFDDEISIAGHAKEEDRWERVKRIAESYGGSASRRIFGNNMTIRVSGKIMLAIVDFLVTGKTAIDKGFAPVVWRYSNNFIDSMLAGYLSGDGSWDESNNRWRLSFVRNYNLERDLRTACARLSYHMTLKMAHVPYNGTLTATFRGEIRFKRSGHHNEHDTCEVIKIQKSNCRFVYDLGVEDDPHVFALTSGILTHNSKKAPMPEPATDRFVRTHEVVWLLSKQPHYFFDVMAIAERAEGELRQRRTVLTLGSENYKGAHFAVMPRELARICVLSGTSAAGCCSRCGAPLVRDVVKGGQLPIEDVPDDQGRLKANGAVATDTTRRKQMSGAKQAAWRKAHPHKQTGWKPTCNCGADIAPCVVLDPFSGSGTTVTVAAECGRNGIGFDLNEEYHALAAERIAGVTPPLFPAGYDSVFFVLEDEYAQESLFGAIDT